MKVRSANSMMNMYEAMANVKEFHTKKDFMDWLTEEGFSKVFDLNTMTTEFYGYDDRINWNTYLICADMKDYKKQAMLFADSSYEDLP